MSFSVLICSVQMSVCYCVDRFYVVCADMAAQYTVPDSANPGKMFMNYQGLASYLSSGGTFSEYIYICHLANALSKVT